MEYPKCYFNVYVILSMFIKYKQRMFVSKADAYRTGFSYGQQLFSRTFA